MICRPVVSYGIRDQNADVKLPVPALFVGCLNFGQDFKVVICDACSDCFLVQGTVSSCLIKNIVTGLQLAVCICGVKLYVSDGLVCCLNFGQDLKVVIGDVCSDCYLVQGTVSSWLLKSIASGL
jgi:hypothetical protein